MKPQAVSEVLEPQVGDVTLAGRVQATEMRLGELCGIRMSQPFGTGQEDGRERSHTITEQNVVDATVRTLNKLIEVCLDGELGYRTAAAHLHSSKLRLC